MVAVQKVLKPEMFGEDDQRKYLVRGSYPTYDECAYCGGNNTVVRNHEYFCTDCAMFTEVRTRVVLSETRVAV